MRATTRPLGGTCISRRFRAGYVNSRRMCVAGLVRRDGHAYRAERNFRIPCTRRITVARYRKELSLFFCMKTHPTPRHPASARGILFFFPLVPAREGRSRHSRHSRRLSALYGSPNIPLKELRERGSNRPFFFVFFFFLIIAWEKFGYISIALFAHRDFRKGVKVLSLIPG